MITVEHGTNEGRIPLRLRIGVTGHRLIADNIQAAMHVRRAIERIQTIVGDRDALPVYFTVVPPLAEGADQLVPYEVLRVAGTRLEVPLPLDRGRYLELSFSF